MKSRILGIFLIAIFAMVSCNIQERIVFNQDMGGTYHMDMDVSTLMAFAGQSEFSDPEKESAKIDTTVVFSEMMEIYRDSISQLSDEERQNIERLEGFTLQLKMDEEEGVFIIDMGKDFQDFSELTQIVNDGDEVMNFAKRLEAQNKGQEQQDPTAAMEEFIPGSGNKTTYSFENNVFRRYAPKSDEEEETIEEEEDSPGVAEMMKEFDELLENSYMTLEYVFPRKVKSVSNEFATINEDGQSVTCKVSWKVLMDDDSVLNNFEVVLED